MTTSFTREEAIIRKECFDLGIEMNCEVKHGHLGYYYSFIFKNDEDKNFYKLSGTIKENELIKFETVG